MNYQNVSVEDAERIAYANGDMAEHRVYAALVEVADKDSELDHMQSELEDRYTEADLEEKVDDAVNEAVSNALCDIAASLESLSNLIDGIQRMGQRDEVKAAIDTILQECYK